MEIQTKGRMLKDFLGKRRNSPFKGQINTHQVAYKRFRRGIIQQSSTDGPRASTPVAPGWQCGSSFEFDTVCQRLELDSPPRHHDPEQGVLWGNPPEAAMEGGVPHCEAFTPSVTPHTLNAAKNATEQGWVWTTAAQEHGNPQQTGSDERRHDLQPFAILNKTTVNPQGKTVMKLGAPSLLNDYYANLLDCSCNGMVALALGSSVYLWNSETRALVGHLDPCPKPGRPDCRTQSISSLCWSRDGRVLCIGTRRGEVQLWDVEQKHSVRRLPSHLSMVRGLSWKQQLLSSGSVLGHIYHLDPRTPAPLVGTAAQKEGVCSLQWSPADDCLASGSTGGLLHIWDGDITGFKRSHQPVTTMKQPSAVKAMGWCPWQRKVIATGGGWKDGQLRIWDAQSGSCVASVNTNSQICSLQWADKKRYLVTGHGIPHHQVSCWTWEFPSLRPMCQLTSHSQRVLHLAINPDNTHIFSAGADQHFHSWDL